MDGATSGFNFENSTLSQRSWTKLGQEFTQKSRIPDGGPEAKMFSQPFLGQPAISAPNRMRTQAECRIVESDIAPATAS